MGLEEKISTTHLRKKKKKKKQQHHQNYGVLINIVIQLMVFLYFLITGKLEDGKMLFIKYHTSRIRRREMRTLVFSTFSEYNIRITRF